MAVKKKWRVKAVIHRHLIRDRPAALFVTLGSKSANYVARRQRGGEKGASNMGTRAAFWIGDPRNLEKREWLGCVAWDGCEWIDDSNWLEIHSEQQFRDAIQAVKDERDDFASPLKGGWPFPWVDDIFLTDVTYAFFDGTVHYKWFHKPFLGLGVEEPEDTPDDTTMQNVPGPSAEWDRSQPDSIMIFTASRRP